LKEAAKDAGKEFDTVAASIEKINIARAKALGGDKKALAAFLGLGVSREDLLSKTGAQLFTGAISDTVKTTSPEQIAAPLKEVLGRGAGEAVAVLKTDFVELGKTMTATGAIMSSETAAKLKVLGDEFDIISQIIVSQLGPALLAFAEWAYKIILRGAGKMAGGFAFWGGVKAGMEAAPDEKNNPNRTSSGRLNFWKELFDQVFGAKNKSALDAKDAAEKPFDLKIEEFAKRLEKAAEELKSPKPDFSKTEQVAKTMAEHASRQPKDSDNLIKVGNFLGASRGVIANAQNVLTQHAAETATNTRRTTEAVNMLTNVIQQYHSTNPAADPLYGAN